jgi:L-lactate dehydrogenase (cytochrome)
MSAAKLISVSEIGRHNTPSDCWIVVDGQVWDVTDFHEEHPGGSAGESFEVCVCCLLFLTF